MLFYSSPKEDVLKELESNMSGGVRAQKANELLSKYGENKLKEKKKKTQTIHGLMIYCKILRISCSWGSRSRFLLYTPLI